MKRTIGSGWHLALPAACGVLLAGALPAAAQSPPSAAMPPAWVGQLAALQADKRARGPARRKLHPDLIRAWRMRRGLEAAPGLPALRTGVHEGPDGRVAVDLHGRVGPALLARIEAEGGVVIHAAPRTGDLRARVPLEAIDRLAALDAVTRIAPADRAFTRKLDTSQGDVAHRADALRALQGVDGTGVTVGVLSDGVDSLADLQATGDLPPGVMVLPGQAGSGSEGTAMLEIVHDLAPGAQLMFATAFTSQASFAANVLALRAAGADLIVDDVGYFFEGVFQDDDVAAAVDQVVADGALYFSAAGNGGNQDDGTSGVWEGDFVTGGSFAGSPALGFSGSDVRNRLVAVEEGAYVLQWSDPLGGSGNDYDLYLVHPSGTIVAASDAIQDGDDDPIEGIGAEAGDSGYSLVVVKFSGADRFVHLDTFGGELEHGTEGAISGHPGARGAVAVAATDWLFAGGPGGVFDGSESVETFSSDGPRRVFFEADGTPITPGDLSATGGELRAKPDLTAADCVTTATPGFGIFCGTSAAAPHAAALAALLWERAAADGATPEDLIAALAGTALDIEAPGPDRDAGAGIATGLAAGDALAASCANGLDDDGDGAVDLADPGCAGAGDASERSVSLPCDNGLDDDADGLADLADPGCAQPSGPREDPGCDNGLDDDLDGGIDWDGVDLNGDEDFDDPGESPPDAHCVGTPSRLAESPGCGLGPELVALLALRRRRRP